MSDLPFLGTFGRSRKIWDPATLDDKRCEGDPPADDAVDQMLRANEGRPEDAARLLLRQLLGGGHHNVLLGAPGSELLTEFLQEYRQPPSWADRELIEHAQRFGREHLVVGSVLLAVASLPECYLDARGAPVLIATGQLSEQPARRLRHTAHMVFSVCAPGAIYGQPGAATREIPVGISKALTVRLMHALIRRFTIDGYRLPESFYTNVEQELGLGPDSFGHDDQVPMPINQEDLAFVLLTFSYVVLRGLERMGVPLTDRDRHAYVHLWNVIGHIMGVQRELMGETYQEAASLFHALKQRLAGPSPEGQALMSAMLGWINQLVPRPLRPFNLGEELIIHFVGRESAAMLGIEPRGARWLRHLLFTVPLDGFESLKPRRTAWSPLSAIVESLARPMVKRFIAEVSGQRPPPPGFPHAGNGHPPRSAHYEWPRYVVESYGGRSAAAP